MGAVWRYLLATEAILGVMATFHPASAPDDRLAAAGSTAVVLAVTLLTGRSVRNALLGGLTFGLAGLVGVPFLDPAAVKGPFILWSPGWSALLRIGPANANDVGLLAMVGCLTSLAVALRKRSPWTFVSGVVSIGFALVVIGTGSRTSVAGLIAGAIAALGVRLLRSSRARLAVVVSPAVFVVALTVAFASTLASFEQRRAIWVEALSRASDSPLLGLGFGVFAKTNSVSGSALIERPVSEAHNLPIQALLDFGPIGLAAILAAIACTLWRTTRPEVSSGIAVDPSARSLAAGSLVAMIVLGGGESVVDAVIDVGGHTVSFVAPLLFWALATSATLPESHDTKRTAVYY